jgi:adenylate cyclase
MKNKEIERKFLVKEEYHTSLLTNAVYIDIWQIYQGYFIMGNVRIRIVNGEESYITIKNTGTYGERYEFEYKIPLEDANIMMKEFCSNFVNKKRYVFKENGHIWHFDVFDGRNKGLIIAELELENKNQIVELPKWIDKEVTKDYKYYNNYLSKFPYKEW